MEKYKRRVAWIKNQIFLILFGIPIALGILFAYLTVNRYAVVVRGVLGFAVIFLFSILIKLSTVGVSENRKIQFQIPRDLRFFVYNFLAAAILFWAIVQVFNLIWQLIQLL